MVQLTLDPPAPDEIEVSLFGRGVGECVVVHGGGGRWIIVDSCYVPNTSVPAASNYLVTLGVALEDVVLLVATHLDDDHIKGMASLHEQCTNATFVGSGAINHRDLASFVLEQEHVNIEQGSGVDEFRCILRQRAASGAGAPEWGCWNKDLLALDNPFELDVWALSPSAEAVLRGVSMVAYRAHGTEAARRVVDVGPNEGSVALWIRAGDARILLGADLEEPGGADRGWSAIVNGMPKRWLGNGCGSLFKVAHHGSEDARSNDVWTDLLQQSPVAVLTTYSRGKDPPPNAEQRAWINARAGSAWLTRASTRRRRRDREIERQMRAAGKRLRVPTGFGHVRARTSAISCAWQVDCFEDAGPLP